ncbi:hypothetical protein Droror1_Dr00008712 [Drosera rotundifolia]
MDSKPRFCLFQESEGNGGGGTIGGHNMTDAPPLILDGGDYNEQDGILVIFHPDQTAAMPSNNFGGVHGHPHHGHAMMVNRERGGSIMHNNGYGSSHDFAGVEANRGGGTNGSSGSPDSWQTGAVEALLQIILDIDPYLEVNAQRKDAWENVSRNRYKYRNQLEAIKQRRQQAKTSQPPQANHVNGPSIALVHGSSSAPVTDSTSIAGMVYPATNEFQATVEQWQRDIEARLAAMEASNAIMEASIAALEERTGTRPPIVGNASASSSSEDQREENAEDDVQGANDTDIQ